MSDTDQVLEAFARVKSFTQGDKRAPHKPILLLLALAAVQRGERWLRFSEVEASFRSAFFAFGPYQAAPRLEFPFWRLQNDGIWSLPQAAVLRDHQNASGDVPITRLREVDAQAGFTQELFDALYTSPELVNAVAEQLLAGSFPPSIHQDFLDAIGFQWTLVLRRSRRPAFRVEILRIYERRCAVCGYDGRLGMVDLAIEAGHIKWHAAGGPDTADNGLALCSFHHVALDRGAISIDDRLRVMVSQDVVGTSQVEEMLLRFSGQPLLGPQLGSPRPSHKYLQWHQEEVFCSPARTLI